MKRILTLLIFCLTLCGSLLAQNELFRKYAAMDDIKYVSIGKSMLEEMAKKGHTSVGGVNIKGLGPGMPLKSILIISSTSAECSKQMKEDEAAIAQSDYETIMVTREGKKFYSTVYFREARRHNELVMFVDDTEKTTFIVLMGTFSLQDVQRMFM